MAQDARKQVFQELSHLLADTYLLYLKTQKFHWNVEGENFSVMHKFFEELYESLGNAVDEIAERIRTIGYAAPGSFQEFLNLTSLKESVGQEHSANKLLKELEKDYADLCHTSKTSLDKIKPCEDIASEDLMTQRLSQLEKELWMIKAHLKTATHS